jgi:restriction system protein
MYAQVITEIKRQQKRGERPRFVQHGRGYVGLSQWMGRGLAFQIEQHNHQVRKALRDRLLAMKPGEFEELISQLLAEMGFEMVEVTKLSGDGGIDVRGTLVVGDVVRIKMAIQVKKWKLKNNILAPVVQQVRGSLGAHEQGLIITTSDFSAGAIKEADTGEGRVFNFQGDSEHFVLLPYGPPRATAQVDKTPRPLRKDDARRRTRPPVPSAPARKDPGRDGKDRTHPFC